MLAVIESSADRAQRFAEQDVEMLKIDDWFIRRFLAWKPTTLDEAVKTMTEVMEGRHEMGITTW